uniref:Uncharacterized protein n=1 Tax=Arundo donax TaxID=35708 RepID=A0A0A9APA0_ARUDO
MRRSSFPRNVRVRILGYGLGGSRRSLVGVDRNLLWWARRRECSWTGNRGRSVGEV